MHIQFWSIGKDHDQIVVNGIADFTKRINNYYLASWKLIPTPKYSASLDESALKRKESEVILNSLSQTDYLVLLDERGKPLTSVQLAQFIQQRANESSRHLVFLIGGAYGVHESVLKRANLTWSLSTLTFPHQLVRLMLAEQVYRACTILRNEKYHHS